MKWAEGNGDAQSFRSKMFRNGRGWLSERRQVQTVEFKLVGVCDRANLLLWTRQGQ